MLVDNVINSVQPAEEFALERPNAGEGRGASWFDALFQEHYPRITSMLARLTGDRGQSEEIAADVFCKLSRQWTLLQGKGELTAWVYRVATNAGLDALRSNSRRRRREQEAGVETLRTASRGGALEGLLREERCARVRDVLQSLKPREAQLLLLRSNGMAYREIAEALGIPPGSVGTMLVRAEAEFERKFRARYGDRL
ncbi:RNA polymerase, sigma-24 subunit, ECF subfamily [Candidatus Sulfopaludibacter sp. SbA3]|nr:RNA polymerase, sigma-24 subunit, ECF subfamily [Candidatus Sulfopaludibacter sp. SbA3]